MRLNIGCGFKKRDGFVNIDSSDHCEPDMIMNVEDSPWPFENDSIEYILMESVLEHLPNDSNGFFSVVREIYRVCKNNAIVEIECPYPNHRWQVVDFTHQKAVHPEGLCLLDRKYCIELTKNRSTKTPLAVIYDIDFELVEYSCALDRDAASHIEKVLGVYKKELNQSYNFLFNNIGSTQRFKLRARKDS